jgi:hypothetical protein
MPLPPSRHEQAQPQQPSRSDAGSARSPSGQVSQGRRNWSRVFAFDHWNNLLFGTGLEGRFGSKADLSCWILTEAHDLPSTAFDIIHVTYYCARPQQAMTPTRHHPCPSPSTTVPDAPAAQSRQAASTRRWPSTRLALASRSMASFSRRAKELALHFAFLVCIHVVADDVLAIPRVTIGYLRPQKRY